jgi:Lon protease-like protein
VPGPALELPLFPLSQVVLFPRVRAPLHVFEPRYRQMMQAALAGARTIGMVTVLPEHTEQMAGDPPIFEIGCAGFVEAWERLADGRYNLVLHGTQRFRVLRERPREGERLYRVAEVELLADEPVARADPAEAAVARARVVELLRRLLERSASPLEGSRLEALDHETFANTLCQILGLPPEEKQGLLEAAGPRARLDALEALLHFHLVKRRMPPGGASEALH